jgi:hypothetical protein
MRPTATFVPNEMGREAVPAATATAVPNETAHETAHETMSAVTARVHAIVVAEGAATAITTVDLTEVDPTDRAADAPIAATSAPPRRSMPN